MLSIPPRLSKLSVSVYPWLLAAAAAWVFLPGLDNQLVSDDWVFVYQGVDPDPIHSDDRRWFTRPVVGLLSFVVAQVVGFQAAGFNAGSLFFHLLNTLLLASILRLLVVHGLAREDLSPTLKSSAAWAATGLFLLYPLHHEAVFWYSSVTELTALCGRLLVLNAAIRLALRSRPPSGRGARPWLLFAVALCGMVFALASKESAVVLPAELFLLIAVVAWPRRGESWRLLTQPRIAWGLFATCSTVTLAWLAWYRSTRGFSIAQLMVLEATPGEWVLRVAQGGTRALLGGPILRDPRWLALVALAGATTLAVAWWRGQRLVLFSSGWLVLCLLPYLCISSVADHLARVPIQFRLIGIGDDRYFYGAAAAYSVLALGCVLWLSWEVPKLTRISADQTLSCGIVAILVLSLVGGWRLSRYERQWDAAGDWVDSARREISMELPLPVNPGEVICVRTRPDNLDGRFVLRNGVSQLLWLHAGHRQFGVLVPPAAHHKKCTRHLDLEAEAPPTD